MMRGIGEILGKPLALPQLAAVLVNPGVAVPTRDVFAALAAPVLSAPPGADEFIDAPADFATVVSALGARRNDLEAPAIALAPVIADVLAALRADPGCRLARMSGSGATCFGLFASAHEAQAAARGIASSQPGWWVRATNFR